MCGKWFIPGLCLLSGWPWAAPSAEPSGFVVLETAAEGAARIAKGEPDLAEFPACPASTFKMVIAIAALEIGAVSPGSKHRCADTPIGKNPRDIDMREAMRLSSNDYFLWLSKRIGVEKIGVTAQRLGFAEVWPTADWIGDDAAAVVRGGTLKVTARRLHDFTVCVMRGKATLAPHVQRMLEEVLCWPGTDNGVKVFGKTGAWGGAAWFTGFVDRHGARQAITVFVPYKVPEWRPARERAIDLFYSMAGTAAPTGAMSDAPRQSDN